MSARSGRLARTSGSAVNRLAAISGSDAFLAPPILIVPDSGTPPRIRIWSIVSAPGGDNRPHRATERATLRRVPWLYARRGPRSSRRLVASRRIAVVRRRMRLPSAGLLLAAPQVFAQRPRQAFLARGTVAAP